MGHEDRVQEDVEVLLLDPVIVILLANSVRRLSATVRKLCGHPPSSQLSRSSAWDPQVGFSCWPSR